jgi:hypothetical protein
LLAQISQVSFGQAFDDLQNAFTQVITDLQRKGATPASGTAAKPLVRLHAFLTHNQ